MWNLRKKGKANLDEISYQSQQFLSFPRLGLIGVDEEILASAHTIMKELRLKPRESIHVVSSMSRGLSRFVSDDSDFDDVKSIKRVPIRDFPES